MPPVFPFASLIPRETSIHCNSTTVLAAFLRALVASLLLWTKRRLNSALPRGLSASLAACGSVRGSEEPKGFLVVKALHSIATAESHAKNWASVRPGATVEAFESGRPLSPPAASRSPLALRAAAAAAAVAAPLSARIGACLG